MDDIIRICNQQYILSGKIYIFCMLLPVLVGLIKWSSLNKTLKWFFGYCLATLLVNGIELLYLSAANRYQDFFAPWFVITDNSLNFLLILYQLKNFLLLGWFFSSLLLKHGYGRFTWNLSIVLSLLAVAAYIFEQGWRNYGTIAPTLEACFLFVIPLFYLWHLSRTTLAIPFLKNSYFLISLGLALPNLIGLFLYFFAASIQAYDFCLFTRLGIAKNGFEILGQLLFALAFWRAHFTKYIPPTAI